MYRFFLLALLLLISTTSFGTDFIVQKGNMFKANFKNSYPIQLIHSDDEQTIFSKGNIHHLVKEIEILNKNLRTARKITIQSNIYDRVNHIIWTGESFILLWEKKNKRDKALYYQVVAANGRRTNRSHLINIEDGFSNLLKEHEVQIIPSLDQEHFGFVVKSTVSKSMKDKNLRFNEFIVVFDKKGKLVDKQRASFSSYNHLDNTYFINQDSELLKIQPQFSKEQINVSQKSLLDGEKESFQIDIKQPDKVHITSYQIAHNEVTNTFDLMGYSKTHDSIQGFNGLYFSKLDLNQREQVSHWNMTYEEDFLMEFKKSPKFPEGNILYNDWSLNEIFQFRKVQTLADGSSFIISEYFRPYSYYTQIATGHKESFNRYNTQNKVNFPMNNLDFIIHHISASGKINWVKRVPKTQIDLGYSYGSFDSFTWNNELYLVYNREKAIQGFTKTMTSDELRVSNIVPIYKKINTEGEVTFGKLDKQLQKMILFPFFSHPNSFNNINQRLMLIQEKSNKEAIQMMFLRLTPQPNKD